MKEMKHDSSTLAWSAMGDEWFELAQTGESRIHFIMPNMLKFMGDVEGKKILDLGCGEGGYSRELAKKGARLVAVDCSAKAIEYAASLAKKEKLQIEHFVRNSNDLFDIESEQFDMVLCSMMLMDCEDFERTLREVVLTIVDMNEPRATDEQAEISVAMAWLQKIPLYLYWELRK